MEKYEKYKFGRKFPVLIWLRKTKKVENSVLHRSFVMILKLYLKYFELFSGTTCDFTNKPFKVLLDVSPLKFDIV
jgi:hypothetical protein